MANHKSAEKRMRQNAKRRARNRAVKSRVKTAIRTVRDPIAQGDVAAADGNLSAAVAQIAKAASKGVLPKRAAARKISRLAKALNRAKAEA